MQDTLLGTKLKKIGFFFAVFVVGFLGGFVALMWSTHFQKLGSPTAPDAISIANTYIVYTTLIFVGFTVVIAILSYIYSQQFEANKVSQISELVNELKEKARNNDSFGQSILGEALKNRDVLRYLEQTLSDKLNSLIDARSNDARADADRAARKAAKLDELRGNIGE